MKTVGTSRLMTFFHEYRQYTQKEEDKDEAGVYINKRLAESISFNEMIRFF